MPIISEKKEISMERKKRIISPEASSINQSTEIESENRLQAQIADMETPAHKKALAKIEAREKMVASGKYITIADQIAENDFYFRNYKYGGADSLFPKDIDRDYRIVTKAYPFARGGFLLVDEPRNEYEMLMAYEKQRVLREKGFRHVVIEMDSTLSDCLEQLGEL